MDARNLQIFVRSLAGDCHAKRLNLLNLALKNNCRKPILIKLIKED